MKTRIWLFGLCSLAALSLASPPAHAVTFVFADPGALAPDGTPAHCDGTGQDFCGTTLSWTVGSLTVTASVFQPVGTTKAIIQDLAPDYGGLGIVDSFTDDSDGMAPWTGTHSGNDNVDDAEGILLTFSQSVLLNSVDFWDDHNTTNVFPNNPRFRFSTNGTDFDVMNLAMSVAFPSVPGTTFYFTPRNNNAKHEFYIAGVDVDVESVPEPTTLGLIGAGLLGVLGLARRRRG
jgi:hypothetical protein